MGDIFAHIAISRLKSWALRLCMAFLLAALFGAAAQAQRSGSFDHFSTGFPLAGAHFSVDCTSCHVGGRFKGTPRQCASCHNGTIAPGKSPKHARTTNTCERCHVETAWQQIRYDHSQAIGACVNCHNGSQARGKPATHVATTAACNSCHRNTFSFLAVTWTHTGITTGCANCHNGKAALGKPATHIATTAACESCHNSTTSFASVTFAHAATDTNCSSCHNGSTATGMKTPPHIPSAAIQCSNCHINTAASFTTYTMNHTAVSASRCDACHNGSYTGEGAKGALGTAPGHVATGGRDCISCHTQAASGFVSWKGAVFAHAAADTNCSSCHNGSTATGMKTPPHIPTAATQCSNCHTNTAASFTTYTMNHTAVSASRCDACHNGSYTAEGTKGAFGTTPGHVATGGRDCISCHTKAASGFVSWSGAVFAHAAADTNCSNCHNGSTATGMKTPPHIPTASIQCSNCHTNTAASFTTYTMNHTAVSASRCDACHNGSYTAEGTKGALGTTPGHVATGGRDCISCHTKAATGFVSWSGAGYTHAAADTNCSNCHNGSTATGMKTPPHIPTAAIQCSNCHTNTAASFTTYTMNHTAVSASRCDGCHNGSYTAEGTKGALGTTPGHVATGGRDCISCHTKAATGFVSWSGAGYTHAAADTNCSNCHNGSTATGMKTPPHIPTASIQCSNCHTNTAASFTTYTMNHTAVSASRCDACHNGSYTGEGTKGAFGTASFPNHVATTGRDCITCHKSTTSFAGATMDHTGITTGCARCHNGTIATGKPATHIATTAACESCHKSTVTFAGATMNHTGITTGCATCHNGTSAKGKPTTHIATTAACENCHKSTTSFAGAKMDHTGITTGCARCHNGTTALGKPATHIATTAACENCHKSTVTFAGAKMDHTGITTGCARCHNGTTALGKPATHIATTAACETCHKSTVSFAGAKMDHTGITTGCATCHNGATATGKPTTHFVTTQPCESCHRTTAWTTVSYRHVSPTYPDHGTRVTCASCHTSNAQTVPWKYAAYKPDCAGCHAGTYKPGSHKKYDKPATVNYTVAELRDCSGACHTYTDSSLTTIKTRRSGQHRANGGGF
jgi:hypothetical protein